MISPNCPDHGRLVLDLALGRLDDAAAAEAESISESCPTCRAWWNEQFEGEAADVVDAAVAVALTDLRLPERRRSRGWIAAAAAIVMAFGVGTLWVAQNNTKVDEDVAPQMVAIQTFDFEVPEAVAEFARVEVSDPDSAPIEQPSPQRVFAEEDLAAVAAPVEVEESSEPLFSGSFESGDFGGWVPST